MGKNKSKCEVTGHISLLVCLNSVVPILSNCSPNLSKCYNNNHVVKKLVTELLNDNKSTKLIWSDRQASRKVFPGWLGAFKGVGRRDGEREGGRWRNVWTQLSHNRSALHRQVLSELTSCGPARTPKGHGSPPKRNWGPSRVQRNNFLELSTRESSCALLMTWHSPETDTAGVVTTLSASSQLHQGSCLFVSRPTTTEKLLDCWKGRFARPFGTSQAFL